MLFDDMIADMKANQKLSPIIPDVFIRETKLFLYVSIIFI